eukprot:7595759-Alexandrium_andersonii.AAC.1
MWPPVAKPRTRLRSKTTPEEHGLDPAGGFFDDDDGTMQEGVELAFLEKLGRMDAFLEAYKPA